jgi:hypothetical protein
VLARDRHFAERASSSLAEEMDAGGNAVGIATLTLEHEGWERDENGNID